MDTRTAIKTAIGTANMISTSYLGDLTDAEMMHRPAPGCNHIKWQVGHLIVSENRMINQCIPSMYVSLEMSGIDTMDRLQSMRHGIPTSELYNPASIGSILKTVEKDHELLKPTLSDIQKLDKVAEMLY